MIIVLCEEIFGADFNLLHRISNRIKKKYSTPIHVNLYNVYSAKPILSPRVPIDALCQCLLTSKSDMQIRHS